MSAIPIPQAKAIPIVETPSLNLLFSTMLISTGFSIFVDDADVDIKGSMTGPFQCLEAGAMEHELLCRNCDRCIGGMGFAHSHGAGDSDGGGGSGG